MRKATLIALLVSTFSLLSFPMSANAASIGALTQLSGTSGCISESGTGGSCVDGNQLGGAGWLALSPDGNYLYVASFDSSAVSTFSRNLATGALTQLNTIQGCIAEVGDGITCADGRGLSGAVSLAVSPDGNHLYVASRGNSVAIFARNINTGVLSQLSGPAGCIAEVGDGVSCADGKALVAPRSIAVSPDGKSVYVTGRDSNAVAIFSRNATTGSLTQLSGTAGCVSNDGTGGSCALGIGLSGARGVTVSPDSLHVYVASQNGNTLAIFSRNPTTGALTQLAGTAGCIAENGDGITCADGRGLSEAVFVTVSPDGNNVYAVSELSNALVAFARDALTGQLTQLTGLEGCISETGAAGTCTDGNGLNGAIVVIVSSSVKMKKENTNKSYRPSPSQDQPWSLVNLNRETMSEHAQQLA